MSEKLDELIKQYDIQTEIGKRFSIYDSCADIIWKKWKEISEKKKIAIYGAGIHTQEIFRIIRQPQNLVCIIDQKGKGEVRFGVPVINNSELEKYQVDVVIISSFKYRKEMRQEIQILYPNIQIVDFYDDILKKGIQLQKVFYEGNPGDKYLEINQLLLRYQREKDLKIKEVLLQDLISAYLAIKDFFLAFKYIQQYIESYTNKIEKYRLFQRELQKLFLEIQRQLKSKQEKSMVVFCIDSLKQSEIKNMSYLSDYAQKNYQFECFMCEYPQTRYSLQTLLTGKHTFDLMRKEDEDLKWTDGELLKYIKRKEITFRFIGTLSKDPFSNLEDQSKRKKDRLLPSEIFWNGLVEILESKKDSLFFFHTGYVIHSPHFTGEWNKKLKDKFATIEALKEQYEASVNYMDMNLRFYLELLDSKNISQIIIGDHGIDLNYLHTVYHQKGKFVGGRWCKEEMNAAFIIKSDKIKAGKNSNILTNSKFSSILLSILSKESISLSQIDEKELQIQILPAYDQRYIDMLIEGENFQIIKGAAGIWRKDGVYLKFQDGQEKYYKNKGEQLEEAVLTEEEFQNYRIQLREEFPKEILKQLKFKYHNIQLKEHENYNAKIEEIKVKSKVTLLYVEENLVEEMISIIKKKEYKIDGICVDKIQRGFHDFNGYTVYKLKDFASQRNIEIIIAKENMIKAVNQLKELEINQFKSIFQLQNIELYQETYLSKRIKIKHVQLEHKKYFQSEKIWCHNIDFVITERCSLRCKDCFNLMPYYQNPQNYKYEELITTLKEVENIFDEICEFRILGGEPFITPYVYKIVDYVSKIENINFVVIYTNGTILPDAKWLKTIDKEKVVFRISNYGPLSKNHDKLIETLEENEVYYEDLNMIQSHWYQVLTTCNYQRDSKEMQAIYQDCYGRDCLTILKGNLYQCEMLANLHNLGKVNLIESDYVNLVTGDLQEIKKKTWKYLNSKKFLEGCLSCGMEKRENLLIVKPAIQITKTF